MAIILGKKAATNEPHVPAQALAQAQQSPSMSLLKRGKAAHEELEGKPKSGGANIRYWLKEGDEARLTFLDGNLNEDGLLDIPFYYEHNIQMAGKYGNFFACTAEVEPCPICEGGHSPSYVGLLTVIDHRSYISKRDGKTYKDQIRLFAAKRGTIKMLQTLATKRGGLAGCEFDVTRTGAQSAAVGSMFDFSKKLTPEQILEIYGETAVPLNYEEIVASISLSAKELRKMGFGSMKGPIGSEDAVEDHNYDDKL